jgi:amidohydrolase
MMKKIELMKNEVISLRRHFHKHPELGFKEFETAKYIEKYLNDIGISTERIATTGVVGVIEGTHPGKTLLLRSDMDALAVEEENDVEYKSVNKGVMHACGHDGHMAMLLVAAKILVNEKDRIHGRIKLVFQPNEEEDGASFMIEEGVLKNPDVDSSFALHLWTPIQSGFIGLKSGSVMAEMYNFKIQLRGKGGHASAPHRCVDPLICASNIIQTAQIIQTREIDPMEDTVLMFGKINGGTASNIIPETLEMEGCLRYLYDGSDDGPQHPRKRFERIFSNICEAHRVEGNLQFFPSNYIVQNDENSVAFLNKNVMPHIVHSNNIIGYCCMGGEDFSEFTSHNNIPGALVFVGTGNKEKQSDMPHHNPKFNIDEDTLITGVKIHVYTALEYLK